MPFKDKAAYREYMRLYMKLQRAGLIVHKPRMARPKRAPALNCEICGQECDTVWDHNHKTGLFRGWLCRPCNLGLGAFHDNQGVLHSASEYLLRSNATPEAETPPINSTALDPAQIAPVSMTVNGLRKLVGLTSPLSNIYNTSLDNLQEERREGKSEGKPRKKNQPVVLLAEEHILTLIELHKEYWPEQEVRERIEEAMAHTASKKWINQYLGVRGWLRNNAPGGKYTNGRTNRGKPLAFDNSAEKYRKAQKTDIG